MAFLRGDGISNREAVYNLMTKNLKVYKRREKLPFRNLRYKINPYIYKFFKKQSNYLDAINENLEILHIR